MASRGGDEYYRRTENRRAYDTVSERSAGSRTPGFLMREEPRGGELVLRSRKVESGYSRRRSPSSSPSPERRTVRSIRAESPSPIYDGHARRARSMSRIRMMDRDRSVSPEGGRVTIMRGRSPSADRFRATITERDSNREVITRVRTPSPPPAPAPEPAPQVIKGPIIEREVITHWRDIDHGVIRVPRSPSPVPVSATTRRSRSVHHRDTDIDIDVEHRDRRGYHQTDVDIDISHSHSRRRSHSRVRRSSSRHFHDDNEVIVRSDRDRLILDDRKHRSHSAAPIRSPSPSYSEEADYITSRIDAGGKMGEAYNGHTKDWTIVDVPPGTERVRMDGVGGASADVTWSRYSGVRRTKFIAERDDKFEILPEPEPIRTRADEGSMSVQVRDREREIEIEASRRRARTNEMWTEITKDLVTKEAIDRLGYEFEETDDFYYIMAYLKYDDVVELVTLSDSIREARRKRARELQWEREFRDSHHHVGGDHHHHIDITATHTHTHRSRSHSHSRRRRSSSKHWDGYEKDREVIIDRRRY